MYLNGCRVLFKIHSKNDDIAIVWGLSSLSRRENVIRIFVNAKRFLIQNGWHIRLNQLRTSLCGIYFAIMNISRNFPGMVANDSTTAQIAFHRKPSDRLCRQTQTTVNGIVQPVPKNRLFSSSHKDDAIHLENIDFIFFFCWLGTVERQKTGHLYFDIKPNSITERVKAERHTKPCRKLSRLSIHKVFTLMRNFSNKICICSLPVFIPSKLWRSIMRCNFACDYHYHHRRHHHRAIVFTLCVRCSFANIFGIK